MTRPFDKVGGFIVLMSALLIAGLSMPASGQIDWRSKVDTPVLDAAAVGPTEFLVYLQQKANLGAAASLATKTEKGRFVYETLTAVAAASQRPIVAELDRLGAQHQEFWIANLVWAVGDLSVVEAMASRGDVAHVYGVGKGRLDPPTQVADAGQTAAVPESNITHVRAPEVWTMGYTGQGAVVANADTGVRWTHNALKNKYRGWNGTTADHNYNWHDAIHNPNTACPASGTSPCDDDTLLGGGHGSHTMGTIVGDDGGSNQTGMAPGAKWIACRNMNNGLGVVPTYMECMQWFIAPTDINNANPDPSRAPHVISNSWGCVEVCPPPALQDTLRASRAAGIFYSVSAGNEGFPCNTIQFPLARYPESFTVGASNKTVDTIADFSSRGPVLGDPTAPSGLLKPNIVAPGVSIRSSLRGSDSQYGSLDGTSMSSPHVAGLVALLISAKPSLAGNVDELENIIEQTAVHLTSNEGCGGDTATQVPNNTFGWGRIDAKAAVDLALQTNPPNPSTPTFGRPTISGIQGNGFEQDIVPDPTNPNRLYTSVPDGLGTATSFLWRSNDAGKTFKWVPAAAPVDGAMPVCSQGGDTEIVVDTAGHLYFNDLSLANFATARSDDGGAHFLFSCAGVAISPTDRQWYAVDGDPTNPGTGANPSSSIYLTFNHFVGDPQCAIGANELVMARSPLPGAGPDAGIHFGPVLRISGPCDEAIMGNNEVSPTTHKIFIVHDNDALDEIRMARCQAVAFGPPIAGVSDPTGLNCVDLLVAPTAPGQITGANFPTMAIDKAGNLYAVWEETEAGGRTVLKYSYSLNEGTTWSTPITLPTNAPGSAPLGGTLNNNVFAWIVAGDDGRVDIAWVGTPATGASPDAANGFWSMWMTQSLNAHDATPTFTPPILVSEHHIHRGTMFTLIGGQNGNRALGDFFQIRMGAQGEALISYADSAHKNQADLMSHAMFVRQNGGPSLLESVGTVNIPGLTPTNSVTDVTNDGTFDANGSVSPNILNLDITGSSVSKPGAANCAGGVDCYRVVMNINNLSLTPPPAQTSNSDRIIQWMTTWMEPSSTNAQGGKFYHVYAESNNGAAPVCFSGENSEAILSVVGGVNFLMTYPGQIPITGAACSVNLATDTVTIDVPVTNVTVPGQIGTTLYSVTATTLTLPRAGNSTNPEQPPNLIDIAPAYDFIPAQSDLSVNKTASDTRVATGRNLTYTVTVTNSGPDAAPDVLLTDVLPSSVTLVSITTDLGSCGASGLTVTCSLGTLGVGATATVQIVVKPTAAGTITNSASVTSLASDPNAANNSDSVNTSVCRITSRPTSIPCP